MAKQIELFVSQDNIKKAIILETDYKGYAIDFYVDGQYTHSSYFPTKNLHYVIDAAKNYIIDVYHPKYCPRKETHEL